MIRLEAARARILSTLPRMGAESVPLLEADGRILAADLTALVDKPGADVSAMDGYALRSGDGARGARLPVTGESRAGGPAPRALARGRAMRIFTGAPLPRGADAVIMQEDVAAEPRHITLKAGVKPGQHVRPRAGDFARGDPLLAAGRRLGPREIGLLAAMNHGLVPVARRPRLALIATGDEVRPAGKLGGLGMLPDSVTPMLAALARRAGAELVLAENAPDQPKPLNRLLDRAAGMAELVVTIGGASVGAPDLVRAALGEQVDFWKIAMRPGKPLIFGSRGDAHVMGLPGNPVSAFVTAVTLLVPGLLAMQGMTDPAPRPVQARLAGRLPANDGPRLHLMRARLRRTRDGLEALPFDDQDSSVQSILAAADGLILRPPRAAAAKKGAPVEVLELTGA